MGVRCVLRSEYVVAQSRWIRTIDRATFRVVSILLTCSHLNDCGAARAPQSVGVPFK
jgi:hypothetical protein